MRTAFVRSVSVMAVSLGVLVAGARAQDVLVVDDTSGTGADFSTLSAAIAAAGEGDTILLRAGDYAAAPIDARSLNVVAEAGALVTIEGTLRISHLSDDQFVSLEGLRCEAYSGPGTEGVHVFDNLGHVWLDDCDLFGEPTHGDPEPQGGPGLRVENSANVVLRGNLVCGGSHTQSMGVMAGTGYTGLVASGSKLRIFDSAVVGGATVCTFTTCANWSAPGIGIDSGTLFLEGSTVKAGYAPPPPCQFPPWDCFGGPGSVMHLHGGAPQVFALGTEFPYGGAPDVDAGQLTTVPGEARAFTISSPVHVGELLTLDFAGAPGDGVLLLVGFEPANVPKAQYKGALLVGGASQLFTLGALPGSGTLTLGAPAPAFPAVLDSLPLVLQAAFITGEGPMLSDPARPILLQPGF